MMNQILISLRKKAGLTQEQLAEKIGVSRQAIANWEKGDKLLLLGDQERGLALLPGKAMNEFVQAIESNAFVKKEDW